MSALSGTRDHPTKVGRPRAELMRPRLRRVRDVQTKPALGIGRPRGAVLGAELAATRARRDGRLRGGPDQREADVAAIAASVNYPCGWVLHGRALKLSFPPALVSEAKFGYGLESGDGDVVHRKGGRGRHGAPDFMFVCELYVLRSPSRSGVYN
jgi:hypothetical protein